MSRMTITKTLKKILPRSISGRLMMIVIMPVMIAQMISIYMFYNRHWFNVSQTMLANFTGEICLIYDLVVENSNDVNQINRLAISAANNYEMNISILHQKINRSQLFTYERQRTRHVPFLPDPIKTLQKMILIRTGSDTIVRLDQDERNIEVVININPTKQLVITSPRRRVINRTTELFVLWMWGATICTMMIAILFLRNQLRPIKKLAAAAERFGRGMPIGKLNISGAKEIKIATLAFIAMRNRILRQIRQRTELLAGISHDLRTPLTRIRLELAMISDKEATRHIANDISDMEKMISGYLSFASQSSTKHRPEEYSELLITEWLMNLVADYKKLAPNLAINLNHNFHQNQKIIVHQTTLKRLLGNLLGNAIKFAKTKILITADLKDDARLFLIVEDDGVGIAVTERDLVVKPFHRGSTASSDSSGLGLAIVNEITNSYGGNLALSESNLGGLSVSASIVIPFPNYK